MKKVLKKRYFIFLFLIAYVSFNHSCLTLRSSKKETARYFQEKGVAYIDSTVLIGKRKLHYLETGKKDAPNLVFIHGSPGSWDGWKAYLSDSILMDDYRLIAPDRPGFGKSNFRRSLSLEPQAKILNELLTQLDNGKPITLIGHSYGGPLIVKMALENPKFYENLVILAGALDPEAEKPEKWRKPLLYFPLKYLVPGALRPSNDELWALKKDLFELQPELHQLSERVLIIHGTVDNLVPYQNVDYMEHEFTNVDTLKTITLQDERHFIVWEREKLVKDSILSFIEY